MNYFTYIILCSNNHYYVGHTNNLQKRFDYHLREIGAQFTRQNKPLRIVWFQEFTDELDAIKREAHIKGWTRAKKENLINGIWK
jgi:putative endonuclease